MLLNLMEKPIMLPPKLCLLAELVPDIPHGLDIVVCIIAKLASKSPYMHIHSPIATIIVISPGLIEQSISCKNPAFIPGEEFKQFVFLEGQSK